MKIKLITIGTLKEKYLVKAQEDFLGLILKRAGSGKPNFELIELKESLTPDEASPKDIASALEEEGKKISDIINNKSFNVILDIHGEKATDNIFSDIVLKAKNDEIEEINIIIGSSHGLSDELKRRSNLRISFSDMTFPHQLFRIALLDAIYSQLYKK
ncbi:MAG: 23S rRNA (pseudouridine(1915)-N(3))-methyltransferase RlmH [Clostridiaceae bacterium]